MLLGRDEMAHAAVQVAEVEVGIDAGNNLRGMATLAGGEGLAIARLGKLIAAIGDKLYAEVEPGGGEGGA